MSDDEGVHLSRRSVLTGTAALGLAGSSTAVAKQFGKEAVTDYDDDSIVVWDTTAWPTVGYDNGNTYYNPDATAPTKDFSVAWQNESYGGHSPVVADGRLYFMRGHPRMSSMALQCLDAEDGTEEWSYTVGIGEAGWQGRQNIAVADGKVFLSHLGQTYVIDAADGTKVTSYDNGGERPKVTDELVLVGDWEFTAISREDGSVRWKSDYLEQIDEYAVAGDTAYVGHYNSAVEVHELFALSLEDGATEWTASYDLSKRAEARGSIQEVVATTDVVYITDPTKLYAFDAETGEELWTIEGGEPEEEHGKTVLPPAVGDGMVYTVVDDTLYGLDATSGETVVETSVDEDAGRVFVAGDTIYYSVWKYEQKDGNEYTARESIVTRDAETGDLIARNQMPGEVSADNWADPELVPVEGAVYASTDGKLTKFEAGTEEEDDGTNEETGDDGTDDGSESDDGSEESGSSPDDGDDSSEDSERDC